MGRSSSVLYFIEHNGKRDLWFSRFGRPCKKNLIALITRNPQAKGVFILVHVNGTELARVTIE